MNKKHIALLILQLAAVVASGVISGDAVYAIGNAVIGVVFNFLVSLNFSAGFLFGFIYAVTNGILAYQTKVYATFVFMILLQAPMAIYSFAKWHSKKQADITMKVMNRKQISLLCLFMVLLGFIMYFVLYRLNSSSVVFDDFFFVFSVTACLLLAFYYKNAYVITMLSGLFGTVLWSYQYAAAQQGLSVAVFYLIVFINSIIAVYQQYKPNYRERCRCIRKDER